MRKNSGSLVLVLGLIVNPGLWAQDWGQWRGPNRDGIIPFSEPKAWPERLTPKWKVAVGEGYASPLLVHGKILQFARQGDDEVAMSLDPENGKVLWRQSYPAPFQPVDSAARHGKGPKSTPLYYDGKLYTFGISGILTSFDAATGKVEWQKQYAKDFKGTWPMFGTSMSPVAADGVVVVLIGTNDDGAVAAYDAKNGAQKWIWKGDGPAYGSPMIVEIGGVKQVVTLTQKYAVGLSFASGDLLWRIDFPGRSGMNIPTPLPFGQRLILAGDPGTMLLQVNQQNKTQQNQAQQNQAQQNQTQQNQAWTTEKAWQITELTMRFSSPVRKGNLIFGFSNRTSGIFFCIDAETGKRLWTSDPRQGDNAVIMLAGDLLFLLKDNAELIVARATGDAFEPLHRYEVADSSTYANPLMMGKGIVIKDNTTLSYQTWE
jgi:outer membrane protein assembly factor BamB